MNPQSHSFTKPQHVPHSHLPPSSTCFQATFPFPYSFPFIYSFLSNSHFITTILSTTFNTSLFVSQLPSSSLSPSKQTLSYTVHFLSAAASPHYNHSLTLTVVNTSSFTTTVTFVYEIAPLTMNTPVIEQYSAYYVSVLKQIVKCIIMQIQLPRSNLFQRETIIINSDVSSLWNFISQWKFIKSLYGKKVCSVRCDGDSQEIGSIIKVMFSDEKCVEFYVVKSEKGFGDNGKQCYCYYIEPIVGNVEMQEIRFMFEEVDNEHTRLVYDNCFKEKVSFGFIDEFTQKKRKFMKQLQCYFIEEYNNNKDENNSNSSNTSNSNSSTTCDREVVTEMFFQYV